MGNVASICDQVVTFVIAYKWAIISILVVWVILSWVCFGKKWNNVLKVFCAWAFSIVMWDVVSTCEHVVTFVIAYKWAIISILVVLVILNWVWDGKKWSNVLKVFCAGTFSIVIFDILFNWFEFYSKDSIDTLSVGFWNFIILIVSAPVAFAIWHFRDENNKQQIENQRKDINLKEFQKLSEWVSGAHLPEIKTVSKTTNKCNLKSDAEIARQSTLPIEYTTEETEEYSKKPNIAHFDTFSKRDGAVALQISAIYNLLPFFRGDYGESFRLPAFNLLKSAWQAMQQDSLKKLEKKNLSDESLNRIFNELEQKANSPMGVALTQVLLSLNRENTELNLRDFPEMLPNICLAGMNFHMNGVSKTKNGLSDLNLYGADFRRAVLIGAKLHKADLTKAKLKGANLRNVNFRNAILAEADLETAYLGGAKLHKTDLTKAKLKGANLRNVNFRNAILAEADLETAYLCGAKLHKANLTWAQLHKADLTGAKLKGANLKNANLQNTCLVEADLQNANLLFVNLKICDFKWEQLKNNKKLLFAEITIYDFIKKIYPDWKKENDLEWEALTEEEQTKAMQQFCDQTKMQIFDESGEHQIISAYVTL